MGNEAGAEADWAHAHDGNRVARRDATAEDADLVGGRQNVGEEQHLLVSQGVWHLVDRGVGEGDSRVLGLKSVGRMAEDPSAFARAKAVMRLLAEAAAATGRDAGDQDAVTRGEGGESGSGLDYGPHRLVAEDVPGATSGTSPFRMWRSVPQMVAESIRTMASVGDWMTGSETVSQLFSAGPW
jgi:hypothetical protein